jgi:hypothetical protein
LLTIHINRDLGTEVVSVYVGASPDRKHYVVHKQLLTSQSDYFDKALNGKFREAEENKIDLEEDDPAAIGLMIGVSIPFLCLESFRFLNFAVLGFQSCVSSSLVPNLCTKTHTNLP